MIQIQDKSARMIDHIGDKLQSLPITVKMWGNGELN